MACWSIAVACAMFMFIAVALIVFVTERNVGDMPDEDVEDFGGSSGGGGGRSGGSSSAPPVPYPSPVVTVATTTDTGISQGSLGPQAMSTVVTQHITHGHPTPEPTTRAPPTIGPPTPPPRPLATPTTGPPTLPPRPLATPTTGPPTPPPRPLATPTTGPITPAPATRPTTTRPAPTPPPVVKTTQRPRPSPTIPVPIGPAAVAPPMPAYPYVCTLSEPVRASKTYLPPDGMCDFMFYDSLYKNPSVNFLSGLTSLELGAQYVIFKAVTYRMTQIGVSFAPKPVLFNTDSRNPKFFTVIDEIWGKTVSHFGFVDLHREHATQDTVTQALNFLKTLHLYLKPKTSASRPSYYVLGLSLEGTGYSQLLNLMKTVFTPSMFIAISHLSYSVRTFKDCRIFPVAMEVLPPGLVRGRDYSYGHTVNESLEVIREVDKMGLSIPLAISFSFRGAYYAPKLANPASPRDDEFMMFQPCQDHPKPYYGDPKSLCSQSGWIELKQPPVLAYNKAQKRAITYLTETTVALLACGGKTTNLKLDFALAAYDVDFDYDVPCVNLDFDPFGGSLNRLRNMRKVMSFLRTNFSDPTKIFDCQTIAITSLFG